MNNILKIIQAEPVAFWTGLVGGAIDLAVYYGAPIDGHWKGAVIALTGLIWTAVARSQASPTPKT